VLEDLYAEYKFPRTALLMAHARGVICLAARQRAMTVLALAPAAVKRAVAGHGSASKEQVQHGVQRILKLRDLPRPSHVADALALAFTGYSRAGGRLP
jgi:crossover junction endodeoxyribonuclease RuvC